MLVDTNRAFELITKDEQRWRDLIRLAKAMFDTAARSQSQWIVPNPAVGGMAEGKFRLGKGMQVVTLQFFPAPGKFELTARGHSATAEELQAAYRAGASSFSPTDHLRELFFLQR